MSASPQDWHEVSVVVTGAAGFVGRHLTARLHALGAHVTAVVRRAETAGNLDVPRISVADVTDAERILEIFQETQPQVVFHLAALTALSSGMDGLERFIHVNVEGTAAILAAGSVTGPQKIVTLGSAEEYDNQAPVPLDDDCPGWASTPYGMSKALAASLCRWAHATRGQPVTVLRPILLYGEGMPQRLFLAQLLAATVEGRPLEMSEGRQTRDFLHVDDAIEGMLAAARCPALDGQVANLCSGEERSLQEVCLLWEKVTGQRDGVRLGAVPYRPQEIFRLVGDSRRLREATGWRPRIAFEDGLRALWTRQLDGSGEPAQ